MEITLVSEESARAGLCGCADPRRLRRNEREGYVRESTFSAAHARRSAAGSTRAGGMDGDPKNPLTARVTVNRMWQELFGTGIVETTERFRHRGRAAQPSGTARLAGGRLPRERLGREAFLQADRDVRDLSPVGAVATPEPRRRIPGNRLLARGPRFRMDAEMLRDTALAASGLLVEKIGGPSVKPYQPPGLWERRPSEQRHARLCSGSWRCALSTQPLYILETDGDRCPTWTPSILRCAMRPARGASARIRRCRRS